MRQIKQSITTQTRTNVALAADYSEQLDNPFRCKKRIVLNITGTVDLTGDELAVKKLFLSSMPGNSLINTVNVLIDNQIIEFESKLVICNLNSPKLQNYISTQTGMIGSELMDTTLNRLSLVQTNNDVGVNMQLLLNLENYIFDRISTIQINNIRFNCNIQKIETSIKHKD